MRSGVRVLGAALAMAAALAMSIPGQHLKKSGLKKNLSSPGGRRLSACDDAIDACDDYVSVWYLPTCSICMAELDVAGLGVGDFDPAAGVDDDAAVCTSIDGLLASTDSCSYLDSDALDLLCDAFDECRAPPEQSFSYCFNDCDSCKSALETGLTGCLDDCEDWENDIVSTYCCHYESYSYGFDPASSYICAGEDNAECANYFVPAGASGMNRDEARQSCVASGGELATIRNIAQNVAASTACSEGEPSGTGGCWLGLEEVGGDATTGQNQQVWTWSDGSTAFTNWWPGEPNNWDGVDERFVIMNCCDKDAPQYDGGFWFDSPDWGDPVPLCVRVNGYGALRSRKNSGEFIRKVTCLPRHSTGTARRRSSSPPRTG